MATENPNLNRADFSVTATLGFDGTVSGRVVGRMFSHVKKADESPTTVSTSVDLDSQDQADVGAVLKKVLEKHRVRIEARTYDERSAARAHARRVGEIAAEVRQ